MNRWQHLRAILLLPGTVAIVVPAISLEPLPGSHRHSVPASRLFITVGRGTLAPWNPTQRLVVRGIYRHSRNPMIVGVACVLLGEASIFGSLALLGWFLFFCLVNVIYIPLVEEPGLAERFGDDYLLYKQNVPRWIPRVRAWDDRH